jgi:hypothetical protein
MKLKVVRLHDTGDATVSSFYINGKGYCGGVEDEGRDVKVKGETRVPEGIYKVALRNEGGYNQRYLDKYGADFHKGMLAVYNRPNWVIENAGMKFQYILIHTGNHEGHTNGCYLPNYSIDFNTGKGSRSGDAYKKIYPIIRDAILAGEEVTIEYVDIESGK